MKRAMEWMPTVVAYLTLSWQESCENPAVFCYRIGSGLLAGRRPRRGSGDSAGQCSNPSKSSSDLFTMFRG